MRVKAMKTYTELMLYGSFIERYRYLQTGRASLSSSFGSFRVWNQQLYASKEWKQLRSKIILRDGGADLGCKDRPIVGRVIIHHLNPLTVDDFKRNSSKIFDPENLICVSHNTHEAIHYGDESLLFSELVVRSPNDQCPWRKSK